MINRAITVGLSLEGAVHLKLSVDLKASPSWQAESPTSR